MDDACSRAHVVPEPSWVHVEAPAPAKCQREFERLFPGLPCFYCGGVPNSVDHVYPASRGGSGNDNLVPCCTRCNQMKSNLTLPAFVAHMQIVLQELEAKGVLVRGEVVAAAVLPAREAMKQAPIV